MYSLHVDSSVEAFREKYPFRSVVALALEVAPPQQYRCALEGSPVRAGHEPLEVDVGVTIRWWESRERVGDDEESQEQQPLASQIYLINSTIMVFLILKKSGGTRIELHC